MLWLMFSNGMLHILSRGNPSPSSLSRKLSHVYLLGRYMLGLRKLGWSRSLPRLRKNMRPIAEAVDLIQEIAVETLGTMTKTKGTTFILKQVRLRLDFPDQACIQIFSRRISPRVIDVGAIKEEKKGCIASENNTHNNNMLPIFVFHKIMSKQNLSNATT
ncbi:hypothetical protein MTR_5g072475 [Medicago truncatula]|uniref:PSMD12/CSN4-like N-terminal domain-containing protein n=1 Tax=Medicago truncatula TaxID=3880 RepID=A0A072UGC1_MEDTR|nr:hypothetical protein MTR_5g072475 [Medicago truncatula]